MSTVLAPVNRLANATPQAIREVDVVSTAYRSVLALEMTYISTPITSGARLYSALEKSGLTLAEFMADKARLVSEVIKPNVEASIAIAHGWVSRVPGAIISPAIFEARALGWAQDEYMAMWLGVLNEKVTRTLMQDGWEYSNGAVEEYIESVLMQNGHRNRTNIEIVKQDGSSLVPGEAYSLMVEAMYRLQRYGKDAPRVLAESVHRMNTVYNNGPNSRLLDRGDVAAAHAFLYERYELLSQVDPAFVARREHDPQSFWITHRQHEPMDAHLQRKREQFPDQVGFKAFTADSEEPNS